MYEDCPFKLTVIEQHANISFCVLLKKSPSETLAMLREAYGEKAMKKTQVYEWHKRFREGRIDVETLLNAELEKYNRRVDLKRLEEKAAHMVAQSVEVVVKTESDLEV